MAPSQPRRTARRRPAETIPHLRGKPLLAYTLEALTTAWPLSSATVAIHADDRALCAEALDHLTPGARAAIGPSSIGGATPQEAEETPRRARSAGAHHVGLPTVEHRPPADGNFRARLVKGRDVGIMRAGGGYTLDRACRSAW
jgi:hypothetical protein